MTATNAPAEEAIPDEADFQLLLGTSGIPWHIHNGISNWVCHGIKPGGFLTAVFTNDLFGAVTRADEENLDKIATILRWIYWNTPRGCRGSDRVLETWPLYIQAERRRAGAAP